MSKEVMMWVHPNFKKKIKVQAAQNDLSIVKFTEILSNDDEAEVARIVKKKPFTFRL